MFQAVQRAVGQMMPCGKGIPVFRGCLQGNPEGGIIYQEEHLQPDVLMRKMDNWASCSLKCRVCSMPVYRISIDYYITLEYLR